MQRQQRLKLKTGMHWLTQDRNSPPGASPASSRKAQTQLRPGASRSRALVLASLLKWQQERSQRHGRQHHPPPSAFRRG